MTKLYVNGDSHTAGTYLDRSQNYESCFASVLARELDLHYENHSLAGGSNQRIIRTSKQHLTQMDPEDTAVLIGWSDTFRTEWFIDNEWVQIAPGDLYEIKHGTVGRMHKQYVSTIWDSRFDVTHLNRAIEQQYMIKEFSEWLSERGFKHLFLHGKGSFFKEPKKFEIEWEPNPWLMRQPYNYIHSFCDHSEAQGHTPDMWYHFGPEAHRDYASHIKPSVRRLLI